jgi:hypothetical protein
MQKNSDIESNSFRSSSSDNEKGKCKYLCCLVCTLVIFIIVIMAITGEIGNKKK